MAPKSVKHSIRVQEHSWRLGDFLSVPMLVLVPTRLRVNLSVGRKEIDRDMDDLGQYRFGRRDRSGDFLGSEVSEEI